MRNIALAAVTFFCINSHAQEQFQASRVARSTGKLPFLLYGRGEDRLGGAKLGYIDTNIVLRIIDSTKDLYEVRLSKYHTAFMERQHLKTDSVIHTRPFYLTNSFSVKGDSLFDYVGISMEEKLPYKSWMEISPSKIMLDIYGVQSNTNWITQLRSLKEIKNVYYNQVEDDVVRVTIELQHKQHWGYSIGYNGKVLVVKVKRQPPVTDIKNLTIAIDAGHGGSNSGATGTRYKGEEKTYTLLFARAFERYLKKMGVKKIVMTRTTDTSFDNHDRILFLQQQDPDILISLHFNSSDNTDVKGVSTYYKYIGFRPLTTALLKRMLELKLEEFGNVGNFNFALNAPTEFPNSLVEIGFLSNEADERRIVNPGFQTAVAKKLYLGIMDWLKTVK
ncbi:MAG: hypothetical protein NVSMB63_19840 [Sediminibacterium sp.]